MPLYGDGSQDRGKLPPYGLNRVAKEPWIECAICSFCIPRSESVLHYRNNKLVCQQCDDRPAHLDNMADLDR